MKRKGGIRLSQCAGLCAGLLLLLAVEGCTVLSYTSPSGERFSRGSLGANTSVAALSVEAGTNGVRRVELEGYRSDSQQALQLITEAAVRAALQAAGLNLINPPTNR